jgi:hypothetical protein
MILKIFFQNDLSKPQCTEFCGFLKGGDEVARVNE